MKNETILLMFTVFALVLIGIFCVYSASAAQADPEARLLRQIVYVTIGFAAFVIASRFDYHHLRHPLVYRFFVCLTLALLVAVLIPGVGIERNGARRWLEIGPVGFQPSEIAKFALILLLAVKLSENRDETPTFYRGYLPGLSITLVFAGLVLAERDLGTPVVMCVAAYLMLFIAGVRLKYLLPTIVPACLVIYIALVTSPYRWSRWTAFLDPWSHADKEGYQLIQSMTAFVKGGIWGRGPGGGEQKLHYLPEAHTDFIFAVWGEEMGLVGTVALTALFGLLMFLAMRIAVHSKDLFGTLLAGGIVCTIAFQAAFNMGVTLGMLPTKGLPLPFISWGGTSLVVFMTLSGILISIGVQAELPKRRGNQAPA